MTTPELDRPGDRDLDPIPAPDSELPRKEGPPPEGEPLPQREPPEGGPGETELPRRGIPGTTPPPDDDTDAETENAYQILSAMLRQWGLESLAPTVLQMLQDGYSTDVIPIMLQDTDAYKTRFAGNEERKRLGLAVLSPAEYLATEASYRQIMQASGLPAGFYDQTNDFSGLIGRDISPTELQRRVDSALIASNNLDDSWKQQFREYYGVTENDLAAYFLDAERGMDVLNRALRGTTIATAARARGVGLSRDMAEAFGAAADPQSYMQQAQRFASYASTGVKLGDIYGLDYEVGTAGEQAFGNSQAARDLFDRLSDLEEAEFSGSSGVGQGSLAQRNQY